MKTNRGMWAWQFFPPFFSGCHPNPWPLLDTSLLWRCMQSTSASSLNPGAPSPELYLRAQPSCTKPAESYFHSSTLNSSTWCTKETNCGNLNASTRRKTCLPAENSTSSQQSLDFLQYSSALLKMVPLDAFCQLWGRLFCAHPQSALSAKGLRPTLAIIIPAKQNSFVNHGIWISSKWV